MSQVVVTQYGFIVIEVVNIPETALSPDVVHSIQRTNSVLSDFISHITQFIDWGNIMNLACFRILTYVSYEASKYIY